MNENRGRAKIDTVKLQEKLEKLKEEKKKLDSIKDEIAKRTNILKDSWESKTSESVFTNFESMYKGFQSLSNNLTNDINFLEKTINDYNEYENKATKEIETNIEA